MANYYDSEVTRAQKVWAEAKARGDKKAMAGAHAHAEKMRQQSKAYESSRRNSESTKQGWHSSEAGPKAGIVSSRDKKDYSRDTPNDYGQMRDVYGNNYNRSYTQGSDGRIYGGTRRVDQEGYENYKHLKNQGKLGNYAYDNVMYRDPFGETVEALKKRGLINPIATEEYEVDVDQTGRFQKGKIGKSQAESVMQTLRQSGYSEEQIRRMVRPTGRMMDSYNLKDSNTISKYVNQRNHADNERYRNYHQNAGDWNNPYVDEVYEKAYQQGMSKPPTDREWTIDDYLEPQDPSQFKREKPLSTAPKTNNADYSTYSPQQLDNQRRYLQTLSQTGNAGQQKWARAELKKLLSSNLPYDNTFGYGTNNQSGHSYGTDEYSLNPQMLNQNIPSIQDYMSKIEFPEQTNNLEYFKEAANQMNIANKAATDSAVAQLEATRNPLTQKYDDVSKEAYINSMLAKRDLGEQLHAQGLGGGATESALLGIENTYQNALNQTNREKANALTNLDYAIAQARATGDMELAKTLAGYYEQMAQAGIQQDNMKFNQTMQLADMAMRQRQSDIDTMMNRQNMMLDLMKYNRGNYESDRDFDYKKQQQDWENQFNQDKFNKQFALNTDKFDLSKNKFAYQKSKGKSGKKSTAKYAYDFGFSAAKQSKPQQKDEKKNKISPEALKMLLSLNSKQPFGWMPK